MTKIKLCGLTRECDIVAANRLRPEYVGFVFVPKSRRAVTRETAEHLKTLLSPEISAVGVFVNEPPERVAEFLECGLIEAAQLHGTEDEAYLSVLRRRTNRPLIKAFRIDTEQDAARAQRCSADLVLLDSGDGGTGTVFRWDLIRDLDRPYFLAGGLNPENVAEAMRALHPFAVDVSSGIETDGSKDIQKMEAFVRAVRSEQEG